MNNETDKLFKNNSSEFNSLEASKKYNYTKSKINSICEVLCISTKEYKP